MLTPSSTLKQTNTWSNLVPLGSVIAQLFLQVIRTLSFGLLRSPVYL